MRTSLFVVFAACAPKGPAEGGGPHDAPARDDSGPPDCVPLDYYADVDRDGFGTGDLLSACEPDDAADVDGDCDDADASVHPDQADPCNGVDDDCDQDVDEDATTATYYVDADGDGYGSPDAPVERCNTPDGYALVAGDCNDATAAQSPGNIEDWTDGIDDDCDGILEIETPVQVAEAEGATWDAPTGSATEVRVLVADRAAAPDGEITVTHDVPEPVVLVLVSDDAVQWVATETYTGTIQQIVVSGPDASWVTGPDGVAVDAHLGASAWEAGRDFDAPGGQAIVRKAEAATGLQMTSFHASYAPTTFTITPAKEWMDTSAYPDCLAKVVGTVGGAPDLGVLDPVACAKVLENTHVCLAADGTTIRGIGLESGDTCTVATLASEINGVMKPNLSWSDEYVYGCDGENGMLQRASLLTGVVEKAWVYCQGVATVDGQLYVTPDLAYGLADAKLFETWAHARCDKAVVTLPTTSNTRIAIAESTLYSSWHAGGEFDWQDLGGTPSDTVTFDDGYDSWVYGIDVADDGQFTFLADDGIRWYDLEGTYMGSVSTGGVFGFGLSCATQ